MLKCSNVHFKVKTQILLCQKTTIKFRKRYLRDWFPCLSIYVFFKGILLLGEQKGPHPTFWEMHERKPFFLWRVPLRLTFHSLY